MFPSKTTPGVADQNDYEEYGYDANGNRTSLRKRDGQVLGFAYDALNRVTIKDAPGPERDVRYGYDLRGLQTSASFTWTGHGISNAYDGFGRNVSTTSNMGGIARTVSHKYDSEGRRTELAFPDQAKAWFARDRLGRMTEGYQGALGDTSHIMVAFAYTPAGSRSYFARKFGDWTSYGYDGVGRLSALNSGFAGGGGTVSATFAYDANGALPPLQAAPVGKLRLRFGKTGAAARPSGQWRLPAAPIRTTIRFEGKAMELEFTAARPAEEPELFIHLDVDGLGALMKAIEAAMQTGRGELSASRTGGPGGAIAASGSAAAFGKVTVTFDRPPRGRGGKMPN
ncbi:MAG TPA: hypothetical protein VF619_03955 [Allosphingosinicella sp.]